MLFVYSSQKIMTKIEKKKKLLPTYLSYFFEHVTPSAVPRRIFILLIQYGRPKYEPKVLKTSLILFNFNQFKNCLFFLRNDLIALFSYLASEIS